jgi:hypothetical protein
MAIYTLSITLRCSYQLTVDVHVEFWKDKIEVRSLSIQRSPEKIGTVIFAVQGKLTYPHLYDKSRRHLAIC